ncbi:hypothetical protein cce_1929 [Crocosphaera subtropica ATCC 51142]|uniref:Transposase n=1 Tax=Crocosphaera subtropica (strain ATCC 51142 / BH68) TaxID=43989 RepID=B1X0J0_CROS5|nr:hypothetical protein cce_1929 [Crocosphaera subtropica ATCC 51142]
MKHKVAKQEGVKNDLKIVMRIGKISEEQVMKNKLVFSRRTKCKYVANLFRN